MAEIPKKDGVFVVLTWKQQDVVVTGALLPPELAKNTEGIVFLSLVATEMAAILPDIYKQVLAEHVGIPAKAAKEETGKEKKEDDTDSAN